MKATAQLGTSNALGCGDTIQCASMDVSKGTPGIFEMN